MNRKNLMADALYAVGVALLFGALFSGEQIPVAAAGLFSALLGYVLGVELRTKRRLSNLEEQLTELKASQSESRGGVVR